MAKFKESFKSLHWGLHHYHTDENTGVRLIVNNRISHYETGRREVRCLFGHNPNLRATLYGYAVEGVMVRLAKGVDCPQMYLPDGTKIAKSWIVDNIPLWIDVDKNVVLDGTSTVIYNGDWAQPYSLRPITIVRPDRGLCKERTALALQISLEDRVVARMGSMPELPDSIRHSQTECRRFMHAAQQYANKWAVDPGNTELYEKARYSISLNNDDTLKEAIKVRALVTFEVPHLLIEMPKGGWLK